MVDDDADCFIEINAVGTETCIPEAEGLVRGPDLTVDTGAGASVGDPDAFPGVPVVPTEASRRGQKFVAAAGKEIPNLGKISPEFVIETGQPAKMDLSAGKVRKPLLAVCDLNRKNNGCWFDGDSSFIIPSGAPELEEIRRLVQRAAKKIPLHMQNGVYKMRTWMKPRPFQGRGW